MSDLSAEERTAIEVQLRFNVDDNGAPLTPEGRAALEARLGRTVPSEISNTTVPIADMVGIYDTPGADVPSPSGIETYEDLVKTLEAVLDVIDTRDSDTHIAVFKWLQERERVVRVGTLNSGYIYQYQEPKGSSKEGYVLGGTQGDRMVDNALEAVNAAGAQPTKHGVCARCLKVVKQEGGGPIVTAADDDDVCPAGTDGDDLHILT